jgi:transposase
MFEVFSFSACSSSDFFGQIHLWRGCKIEKMQQKEDQMTKVEQVNGKVAPRKGAQGLGRELFDFPDITAQYKALDHYGLIVAAADQLGIVETIDRLIPKGPGQILSTGECVLSIIVNFLSGSGQQRLYVTPDFYEQVAVDKLFRPGIEAHHFNDDALGRALDSTAEYGASKLFNTVMLIGANKANLTDKYMHLDTTSMSVFGEYKVCETIEAAKSNGETIALNTLSNQDGNGAQPPTWSIVSAPNNAANLKITHGHSKDHRPDLKQVVVSMMVNGPANLPLFMETLDGNTSDKAYFADAFKEAKSVFLDHLGENRDFIWVADAAFYTSQNVKKMHAERARFITRVPTVLREARKLFKKEIEKQNWNLCKDSNYQVYESQQDFADVEQRWILVMSRHAHERDLKSFTDRLEREKLAIEAAQKSIGRKTFACVADAKQAVKKEFRKFKYHRFQADFVEILGYGKAGKPSADAKPKVIGIRVDGQIYTRKDEIEEAMQFHGKFIIATNVLDKNELSAEEALVAYKKQSSCETTFKFLKNPTFQMNTIFLKRPDRIVAMMMILTLAAAVAHVLEYNLKANLTINNDSVPDKSKKPIQNPSFQLIAHLMKGIGAISFSLGEGFTKNSILTKLTDIQKQLIKYSGEVACRIYFGNEWSFCSGFT